MKTIAKYFSTQKKKISVLLIFSNSQISNNSRFEPSDVTRFPFSCRSIWRPKLTCLQRWALSSREHKTPFPSLRVSLRHHDPHLALEHLRPGAAHFGTSFLSQTDCLCGETKDPASVCLSATTTRTWRWNISGQVRLISGPRQTDAQTAPHGRGSDWKNLPGTAQFLSTQTDTTAFFVHTDRHHVCFYI